ncbi:MAG: hypothetical protein RSD28_03790, partial [Lachnospiraceae bacterium]
EFYPKEVRSIQDMVEEECDKMEYEGSLMFDETPDRLMLSQIVSHIYHNISTPQLDIRDFEAEQYERNMQAEEVPMEGTTMKSGTLEANMQSLKSQMQLCRPGMCPPRDQGLQNIIEVLLYNEMYQRRCRHKRCRRWW